jgi:hypothetical protein
LPSRFTCFLSFAWLGRKIVSIIDITFGIKFAFQSNSSWNFSFSQTFPKRTEKKAVRESHD